MGTFTRRLLMLCIVTLLGALLVACNSLSTNEDEAQTAMVEGVQPTPTIAPQPLINAETLVQNWLTQTPCTAPCWQHITPNTTTITDVYTLLPQEPLWVEPSRIETTVFSDTVRGFIEWEAENHSGVVQFNPDAQPEVVEALRINFKARFALSQVIEGYGDPTHVFIDASTGEHNESQNFYGIWLLYLNHGFALKYTNIVRDTLIDETLKFGMIDFFVPADEGLSIIITGTRRETMITSGDNRLVEWQGFQTFGFYCDIAHGWQAAELCR